MKFTTEGTEKANRKGTLICRFMYVNVTFILSKSRGEDKAHDVGKPPFFHSRNPPAMEATFV